jgi:Skp family chaperone for outer membrane proteins
MIRSGLLAALLLLTAFPAGGQTRFAVVRFEEVTKKLPAFIGINTWMDAEIRKISQDPRSVQFQKMLDELTRAVAEARKLPRQTEPATREEVMAKVESLKLETESLHADLTEFEKRENLRIKRKALTEIEAIEARVQAVVVRIAKERGFDCVFEVQGRSNSSLPCIIYAKNPLDITEDVLAALMAEEKATAADGTTPANPDAQPPAQAEPAAAAGGQPNP